MRTEVPFCFCLWEFVRFKVVLACKEVCTPPLCARPDAVIRFTVAICAEGFAQVHEPCLLLKEEQHFQSCYELCFFAALTAWQNKIKTVKIAEIEVEMPPI